MQIGSPVRLAEVQPLRDCLAIVLSKIDRVLGNDYQEDSFPTTLVHFLVKGAYDHTSILVSFSPAHHSRKPFRFFNF